MGNDVVVVAMDTPDASSTGRRTEPSGFRRLADEPGEPTSATITLLAPWVLAASRPFADWYFGEPWVAAEIITEWMARPTSEVFAGRAIVYHEAGTPRGCIIALSGSELARSRAADFAAFFAEIESEPDADTVVAEIMTASNELFLPVDDDDFYISRVGVDPTWQGAGVGRVMVSHVLDLAASRGHRRVRLDVSAENLPAIRAYEAAGFMMVETRVGATAGLSYCSMIATL